MFKTPEDIRRELRRLESLRGDSFSTAALGDEEVWYDRVVRVNVAIANLIGVNVGFSQWCPNEFPPSIDERLAWIWVRHPTSFRVIRPLVRDAFLREQMAGYHQNTD